MPRGGRRPGAGAPQRNLNALKHGRRSPLARAIFWLLLLHHPTAALRFALTAMRKRGSPEGAALRRGSGACP